MLSWVADGQQQQFLDEFVRLEGRGDYLKGACESCRPSHGELESCSVPGHAIYTCEDCFGTFMECRECILSTHRRLPFHRVKVRFLIASLLP